MTKTTPDRYTPCDMRFFIPGSHPSLSLAELAAVLGPTGPADYAQAAAEAFLIETTRDPEELQERLGGIVKTGTVVGELARYNVQAAVDALWPLIQTAAENTEGKISFGLSVYALENKGMAAQIARDRQRIGLELKKRLKELGRPVRYVDSKERDLSAVIVIENGLLETGGDWALIAGADRIFLGRTEAVQNYKEWGRRDYGRPAADAKSGMLPPKLSRMMVNLAGVEPTGASLLDPFCGSGTVLMEAGLLGFERLAGNDIEAKAVADTKKNLVWSGQEAEIVQGDASNIADRLPGPFDAVVTEPYLGPPRTKKPTAAEAGRTVAELLRLYTRAFASIRRLLRPGGACVVSFPVFETVEHRLFMPLRPLFEETGFTVRPPLPDSAPPALKERTPNGGLLYRRPDAIVSREIIILE